MTGFIIYFTLLSIVHLFFCYFGMHTPRKLTKPLLLTSLAVYYACAAKPVDGAVLAALICGLRHWNRTGPITLFKFFPIYTRTRATYACVCAHNIGSHGCAWAVCA